MKKPLLLLLVLLFHLASAFGQKADSETKTDAKIGLISPVSSYKLLSDKEELKFSIFNSGNVELKLFSIVSSVDDEESSTDMLVLDHFLPGKSIEHTFRNRVSLSKPGLHHVKAKLYTENQGRLLDSVDVRVYSGPFLINDRLSYVHGFETLEEFPGTKSEDGNNDGETWEGNAKAHSGKLAALMKANPADDWYFTHCIQLDAGEQYVITYFCSNPVENSFSKLEVRYGKMQNGKAMVYPVYSRTVKQTTYEQDSIVFEARENGAFYFGFHCLQNDGKAQLLIDDIRISRLEKEANRTHFTETYSLFPNPSAGTFRIQGGNGMSNGKIVIIRNAFGEKLYQNTLAECMARDITFDGNPAGIYLLEVLDKNNKTLYTSKFVIQQ